MKMAKPSAAPCRAIIVIIKEHGRMSRRPAHTQPCFEFVAGPAWWDHRHGLNWKGTPGNRVGLAKTLIEVLGNLRRNLEGTVKVFLPGSSGVGSLPSCGTGTGTVEGRRVVAIFCHRRDRQVLFNQRVGGGGLCVAGLRGTGHISLHLSAARIFSLIRLMSPSLVRFPVNDHLYACLLQHSPQTPPSFRLSPSRWIRESLGLS